MSAFDRTHCSTGVFPWTRTRVAFVALAALAAWTAPLHAESTYQHLQSFSRHMVPLPLRCVADDPSRRLADDTLAIIHDLSSPDDHLVFMMRDGNFTLFEITEARDVMPTVLPPEQSSEAFNALTCLPHRVWVMCGDALPGGVPNPPPLYAPVLNKLYTLLQLPIPTYCGDFVAPRNSTNYLQRQAALLESLGALWPECLTQQFYTALGRLYRQIGSNDAALATYRRGIAQFPDNYLLHRAMADCCFVDCSNYSDAIEYDFMANQLHKRQCQGQPMYEAVFSTARAYERLGERAKAQFQYNDILSSIDLFPDPEWESRTRRYLGDLYLAGGMTNEGVRQFQIDIGMTTVNPAYSYQRLLDVYSAPGGAQGYADTARAYFYRCGTNDPHAILTHIKVLERGTDTAKLAEAMRTARAWMRAQPTLVAGLRNRTDWWALWRAAATRAGVPAEP